MIGRSVTGQRRRWHTWRVAVAVVAVGAAISWSGAARADPDGPGIVAGATAGVVAVRLGRVSSPPAVPEYPPGRCDEPAGGGLTLAANESPNDVLVIGMSLEGRPIWAEHWGPTDGAQVIVVGQIHGNECTPLVLTQAVRRHDWRHVGVWLIPTLNPDGYASFRRYNASGADLNADGYHLSQPESRALIDLTALIQPALTLHVHSPNSFVGWFGTAFANSVAVRMSAATGLRAAPAGTRSGTNWFLWQGQQRVWPSGGAVLLELDLIVTWEAATATERGPLRSLAQAEAMSAAAIRAVDDSFARAS